MSLINKMLRDLSGQERAAGNVMSGIQIPAASRRDAAARRLALLLVLVAGFSSVLWLALGRDMRPPAPAAAVAPSPVAAALPVPSRLRLDTDLSQLPAPATPADSPAVDAAAPPGGAAQGAPAAAAERPSGTRPVLREGHAVQVRPTAAAPAPADDSMSSAALRRAAARLDLARGQPTAAVERLEPAAPPVTQDPEYHGLLGAAYQRLGRHAEATRVYRALLETQPEEAHWWAAYGLSRDALGDAPGALAAYAQARKQGSLDPRVLEHINRRTAALQAAG